ncbi:MULTISPECIES: anaerobic ribonucleoside-triphosphate reductase [Sulfurihydrogenibium]|jgi:anaerobic ribonucleoside-triphosphate reductase|uniref:anaerobic ribonucleoside-triphosphate reductase n=1 Tax=Sulfurihydrogenibium TaxID=212790 RepID=UPI000A95B939|nr:anaerobic ribonucleoside-triphosphate reductase [Sulfurihydrogenibium subterraneum]
MVKTAKTKEEILQMLEGKRTKTLQYTRVVGYYRPIESFNKGKKGEFKERVYFKV